MSVSSPVGSPQVSTPLSFTQLLSRIQSLPPGPQLEQALLAFSKLYPGRKDLLVDHNKRLHYLNNPLDWVYDKLKYKLWSKQEEVLLSIRDNRRTAVPSCFESGKSFISAVAICHWIDCHLPGEARCVTCYTDTVEVLTKKGWKLFKNISIEHDEFATRNQITKEFEWQRATRYYNSPYDGEVVELSNRNLKISVTPNHRVLTEWLETKDGKTITGEIFKRADAITSRGSTIPLLSDWKGISPDNIKFGNFVWSTKDFAAFLGSWLAEGSLSYSNARKTQGVINISQKEKSKGFIPYNDLLERMLGKKAYRDQDRLFSFWCPDLWCYLRSLGTAETKYVPEEIKQWSKEDLKLLLHYYLLGDGNYQKPNDRGKGCWRANTISKILADDLQEIAQKVGMSASITIRKPRLGGVIDGRQIGYGKPCYHICFNKSRTRLIKPNRKHYLGNVYCVSVPNESLYVRENGRAIWCGNTAPTGDQVKSILWQEIGRTHERGKLLGRLNQTEWWVPVGVEGREELVAFGRKPRDQGTASFQGIHEKYVLVVPDEAAGIDVLLMNQIEGLLGNEYSRLLLPGNPEDSNSEFAKECQPGSKTNVIQISAYDTPNFQGECLHCGEVYNNHIDDMDNTPNEGYACLLYKSKFKTNITTLPQEVLDRLVSPIWVEERKVKWGEESPLFISKVKGQFPDSTTDNLIPLSWVRAAQQRTLPPSLPIIIGSDVGGGGDKNVNYLRRGKVYRRIRSNQVDNTMTTLDNCIIDINNHRASQLRIDSIGIGRGASDRAKQITKDQHEIRERPLYVQSAKKVEGIEVSSKASKPESFVNLRSEGYWNLRELFNPANGENIDIDPNDDDLANELVNIKYTTSNGRIQIESKKEMKARTKGKSPDNADSLMLASLDNTVINKDKKKKAKVY